MARLVLIVSILFYLNYSKANVNILEVTKDKYRAVIDSGTTVANENFNFRKLTAVVSKEVEVTYVDAFLKAYKGTVSVESRRDAAPGQIVIIVGSFKSFVKIMSTLKPDLRGRTLLNSGAKFLILLLENAQKIDRITRILWGSHATNIVIVANSKNKTIKYTYYPYKNHLDCQNTNPEPIGHWNETSNKNLYPDKMKNMRGCPLYISTNKLYHPVTEQKIPLQVVKKTMTRLLRDVMNFTPIISTRDYISIDSDRAKNWSDSLNDVIIGFANISTCSIPLGIDRLGLLDFSFPYFRVRLAWLAPPVVPGPMWYRLLSPLNGYLWLITLVITFFVTSLPFAVKFRPIKKFCYRYFKDIDKLQSVAIRIWGVMLGQPIKMAPRRFRDFYLVGLWLWFTFVVRSSYQSVLIGALKTETLVGQFEDLKETIDRGYRFGGRGGVYAHFEHDPLIREGFETIPEDKFENYFYDIIEGRQKFVLATSVEYAWAYCLSQGKKEDECGYVLPDSILTVPLVVWMKMYSPFKRPLSVWLPRFIESGLLDKDSVKKPPCCMSKATDPSPLTRHQVLSLILCLMVGYTISLIVFSLEVMRSKIKKLNYRFIRRNTITNFTN